MRSLCGLDFFLGYLYMRHVAHVAPRVTFPSVIFHSKIIYLVPISVPFILNGNSLIFDIFRDFFKKSRFRVPLDARRLEFRENLTVSEFNEILQGN